MIEEWAGETMTQAGAALQDSWDEIGAVVPNLRANGPASSQPGA